MFEIKFKNMGRRILLPNKNNARFNIFLLCPNVWSQYFLCERRIKNIPFSWRIHSIEKRGQDSKFNITMSRTLLKKLAPVSSGVLAMGIGAAQGTPRYNDRLVAMQAEAQRNNPNAAPRDINRDVVIFGSLQYPANDPIEDRIQVARLDVCGGWWFSIYDGQCVSF